MTFRPADLAPAGLQRVCASGRLAVVRKDGRTAVETLYQEGAAKIRMPLTETGTPEAVLINTAGGLTGGDVVDWRIEAGEGTSLVLTTQACEKIYRAASGRAEASVRLSVASGARVAWLPQESIVFDRSAFRRRLFVDLAEGAEALILEATIFGRLAMGECVGRAEFRDCWRVRQEGRLIHGEDFAAGPDLSAMLAGRAATGGAVAMATLLLVSPRAADRLDEVRAVIGDADGASAWRVGRTGKLLARLVAPDGYGLRKRLVPLVDLLNGRAGLPKTWSI
ncbi:urease accessory protein UreD [Aquamicrobium sp. LC103]|uniref:urease accessory protein UreD n=1 Tax=Aquamicrobium sp. LC103 TaxID=1120658 RepID=UPI0010CA02F7|nr:urease accessory protein UreD [Aquamicrobium sp. LC103]TKT82514.1 urease accessory protein UreD [Aquamicrobium sp. LC103]